MPKRESRKRIPANRHNAISFMVCLVCGALYLVFSEWTIFNEQLQIFMKTLAGIGCIAGALFPLFISPLLPRRPPQS